MTWSRFDPGAGNPNSLYGMAELRRRAVDKLENDVIPRLRTARAVAGSSEWSSESGFSFGIAIDSAIQDLGPIADQHEYDARLLDAYAAELVYLKGEAASLHARDDAARDDVHRLVRLRDRLEETPGTEAHLQRIDSEIHEVRQDLQRYVSQWDSLTVQREQADRICISGLSGIASQGGLAALGGAPITTLSDAALLTLLGGLTAAELLALLRDDDALASRIAGLGDPAAVSAWWNLLGQPKDPYDPFTPTPAQQALLEEFPEVFGNLDGIPYTHRDIANREAFEDGFTPLKDIIDAYPELLTSPYGVGDVGWMLAHREAVEALEAAGYTLPTFLAEYNEGLAIQNTLDGEADIPYQFVIYVPGDPTLAAVSVGNMDTASQITTNVPGMGSTVTKSLQEWTLSAENLYMAQSLVDQDTESGFAVVAWIGYDAPKMATEPSLEVISSDNARAGAPKLVDFLEGITGTNGWAPGENLSVVAHSYGTTVASLALAETPAENFVMLGSAGIDSSIPSVSDLMVDPAHVWASEASKDYIADLGRGEWQTPATIGGINLPGTLGGPMPTVPDVDIEIPGVTVAIPAVNVTVPGVSVNIPGVTLPVPGGSFSFPDFSVSTPSVSIGTPSISVTTPDVSVHIDSPNLEYDHPINPTDSSYGAHVFSSEGATVGGVYYPGSDWHSTSPQVDAQLNNTTSDQYGYLDANTNPLTNAAHLSLGVTDPAVLH
ncbi:MAG: alpha/beta hydrolase [Rhodoglobus sp.]